jgi:hypothetical protein
MYNPQARFQIQRPSVYTVVEAPNGEAQRIERGSWQERNPPPSRETTEVELRRRGNSQRIRVPSSTGEEGMKQVLASDFGENVRKQWRVTTRNRSERIMERYALNSELSYELVSPRRRRRLPRSRGS